MHKTATSRFDCGSLARDPDILLLDEATSSLDPETELVVQNAMQAMLGGRTALIIATLR